MNISSAGSASSMITQLRSASMGGQKMPDMDMLFLDSKDATANFQKFMKQTPLQRLQSQWLTAHGITRAKFEAKTPDEQQKIMDQMNQEIQASLKQKQDEKTNAMATAATATAADTNTATSVLV